MDEVPLPQRALFALDEQECLAGKDKKVFLVSFPMVDRHRRTRREHANEDADLRELSLTLELAARRLALAMEPTGVASVQDEPSLPGRHEPGLGVFERGRPYHPRSIREPVHPVGGFSSSLLGSGTFGWASFGDVPRRQASASVMLRRGVSQTPCTLQ